MTLGPRALAAAACLVGACGGSTEPGGAALQGTWQLQRVDGQTLPAVYETRVVEGRTIEYSVLDGRLEFRTRQRVYDIRGLDFLGPHTDTLVSGYAVEGARLLLMRTGTAALAAYTDTGTVDDATITLHVRHLPGKPNVDATLLYTRVP